MHTQILVIGSGPAGLTAAIYTTRAGLKTTLISGKEIGGQLTKTHKVENFPGFIEISGLDLMDNLKNQAINIGTEICYDEVINLNLSKTPFTFKTKEGKTGVAESVIIASGASPKWLKATGEDKFKGNGISVCATCDGFFYRNKIITIIGGGNTALYEALFLSKIAQKVYIISRNQSLTGDNKLKQDVLNNSKITIHYFTEVIEFKGDKKLSSIVLHNKKNDTIFELETDGVFEAIGITPNIDLIKTQLAITKKGYIKTNKRTMSTSIPGVFACGDVQEETYKQAIISAGSGAIAALSAEKYLLNSKR